MTWAAGLLKHGDNSSTRDLSGSSSSSKGPNGSFYPDSLSHSPLAPLPSPSDAAGNRSGKRHRSSRPAGTSSTRVRPGDPDTTIEFDDEVSGFNRNEDFDHGAGPNAAAAKLAATQTLVSERVKQRRNSAAAAAVDGGAAFSDRPARASRRLMPVGSVPVEGGSDGEDDLRRKVLLDGDGVVVGVEDARHGALPGQEQEAALTKEKVVVDEAEAAALLQALLVEGKGGGISKDVSEARALLRQLMQDKKL